MTPLTTEKVAPHFLMVTQAMRPGNWTVGDELTGRRMTQIPLKGSFRKARNIPDYVAVSVTALRNITVFFKAAIFHRSDPRLLSAIVCPERGLIS